MDYTPDITMRPWNTAAYPYQAPDAPEEFEDCNYIYNEEWGEE